MPEMDGIQALKAIRKIDPSAQVIMVSAMGSKDNILGAVKSGAKNFIVKPFDENKVLEVVKSVLKK
jgi:two-component system chemotaxis response regulator CheY